jgi:hypothetical protein
MIPFGLRLIKAELGFYLKNIDRCLTELHQLLLNVEKIVDELKHDQSTDSWMLKTLFSQTIHGFYIV